MCRERDQTGSRETGDVIETEFEGEMIALGMMADDELLGIDSERAFFFFCDGLTTGFGD